MSAEMQTLDGYEFIEENVMRQRASAFLAHAQKRRTVRNFSSQPVPDEVVESCLRTAMTAPSGANQQPWTFVWIKDPAVRAEIRSAAETEEREFYGGRASEEWLTALVPFGTDDHKPFLQDAPVLIAVFAESWKAVDGERKKNYYVSESVGIATGFLIASLHHVGLASLTHTPSPMKFLNNILGRSENERPYVLLAVGYPADNCQVPVIVRKNYSDVVIEI